MIIAVDLGRKANKQTNKQTNFEGQKTLVKLGNNYLRALKLFTVGHLNFIVSKWLESSINIERVNNI